MSQLEIAYEDDVARFASVDNLVIAGWWNAPTAENVRVLHDLSVGVHDNSKGMGFVNVIYGGTPKFSNEVRHGLVELTQRTDKNSVGAAHALLIGGLVGVTVRTFLSTIFLVARTKDPQKVFSDLASTAEWMAPRLAEPGEFTWTAERLQALLEEMGKRHRSS